MQEKIKLVPGQQLITNKDFEVAIAQKAVISAIQNGMQIRPATTIVGYNDDSIRMSDGSIIHRGANSFFV
ncbi:hypothetical protein BK133_25445 [Paenibacillus sp. FSL H8-0548]|uniref:hypothetical protein n=1 Tax=Paenibacillus sp. FSL H8-0548 TaxID=1920422 RepID=UPI00096F8C39|nr:hypothetical protein [Paenibacillus sp. FSL H8-0548]OMF22741.1 hypothetical protein BK133_25445 [Paenibacillus sp. FSL H8-0548]